jgi:hypothetical protein
MSQVIEKHTHDFNELSFVREPGLDRFILARTCKCGEGKAFECGTRDEMRRLYKKIKQKEKP